MFVNPIRYYMSSVVILLKIMVFICPAEIIFFLISWLLWPKAVQRFSLLRMSGKNSYMHYKCLGSYFNSAQNHWLLALSNQGWHSAQQQADSNYAHWSARNSSAQGQETSLAWYTALWKHFSACFPLSRRHKTLQIICSYLRLIMSQY